VPQQFDLYPGVVIQGLMTMAAHEANPEACRATFRELRELRAVASWTAEKRHAPVSGRAGT
jgi:uncharacterized pyridoxal phosphate-containing UPF0001 family protein